MLRWQHRMERIHAQRLAIQVVARRGIAGDAEIHLAAAHALQHTVVRAVAQRDADAGPGAAAAGHPRRYAHRRQHRIGRDLHHALRGLGRAMTFAQRLLDFLDQMADPLRQVLTCIGQLHLPRGAIEQTLVDFLLEFPHATADRRLREAQFGSGAGKALLPRHRCEGLQLGKRNIHGAAPCSDAALS